MRSGGRPALSPCVLYKSNTERHSKRIESESAFQVSESRDIRLVFQQRHANTRTGTVCSPANAFP
jgi:hypothetical protein